MFKNFFKDAIIYGMSVAISKLLLFLGIPIFTRIMSVESYGIIGFIGSLIGLIGIVMKIGMNNAVQRYYFDVEENNKNNVISSGLKILGMFSTLILILSIVIILIFETYFFEKGISFIVLLLAVLYIFFLQYIIFIKDVMRLYFKPWVYFFLEIAPVVIGLLLAFSFVMYFDWKIKGYFLGYALGTFIVLFFVWFYHRNLFSLKVKTKYSKELLSFGYPFIFVGLASWIFQSADRWMLLEFTDTKQVGLYSVAYQVSSMLLLIVTTFGIVWSPYSMKILQHKIHKKVYASVGIIWYLVLAYLGIILSLFFNDIIKFMLDIRYVESISIGIVLIATIISIGTVQITVAGISIAKKTTVLPWITAIVAIVNIILNYFLIPEFHAFGASIATLISNILLTGIYFYFSQKFYYIKYENFKLLLVTVFIISFYILLFSSSILNMVFIYKLIIFLGISLFFVPWLYFEGQKLKLLIGGT
jgi:O-antigen/teichoic acid export membrane protein